MIKILTIFILLMAFNACSSVEVNATICQKLMNDPTHPNIPQECRDYSEKEAQKAFDKVVDEKKVSDQDIEFSRDK